MSALKKSFLKMLTAYRGILHKVSMVYFRNPLDREDNIQEIVYQLWKSYPRLQKQESIGSWIYAVAIRTSLSRLKSASGATWSGELPEIPYNEQIAEEMDLQQQIDGLMEAIYRLSPIDKTIMLLYLEERSYEETASILGIKTGTVGVRINRAKKILYQQLKHLRHER